MTLPADIKQLFFETLHGDRSSLDFERWLYADKRLESIVNSTDYLDFISYDYKSDTSKYGLYKLLEKFVDKGEYETWKIRTLMTKALQGDKDLPNILMTFYDLYCKGYSFLDNLAIGYGLPVEAPYPHAESWEKLSVEQQKNILDNFYPQINSEIEKVIDWLDNRKVILTGNLDVYDHFVYIDNRSEQEKKPTAYLVSDYPPEN